MTTPSTAPAPPGATGLIEVAAAATQLLSLVAHQQRGRVVDYRLLGASLNCTPVAAVITVLPEYGPPAERFGFMRAIGEVLNSAPVLEYGKYFVVSGCWTDVPITVFTLRAADGAVRHLDDVRAPSGRGR